MKFKKCLLPAALLALLALCLLILPTQANAAAISDLTFRLNADRKSYAVTDCKESATGVLVIPATYNGLENGHICGGTKNHWRMGVLFL